MPSISVFYNCLCHIFKELSRVTPDRYVLLLTMKDGENANILQSIIIITIVEFLVKSYSASDSMLKNLLSSKILPSLLISLMPSSELDMVLS